jgi:CRP/FNR family cyclic AMP-dependent transcriptional regulator
MAYRLHVIPQKKRRITRRPEDLNRPVRLQLQAIENYPSQPMPKPQLFSNLPPQALEVLGAISSPEVYLKGAILLAEGQDSRGVFAICNGRVKLSAGSARGRSLILRIAGPGEAIGLASAISGIPCEATAEALGPVRANFIPRDLFLQFLREHGEAALEVAEMLSEIYLGTYQEVRCLGLSGSTAEKLARFLLDLTAAAEQNNGEIRAALALTHEEISEMIGASRETVTRLFADFKRKRLIEVHDSTLVITHKAGLEKLVET